MYRALVIVLSLIAFSEISAQAPQLKFRRGVELLESYRELLPRAFEGNDKKRAIAEVWNNVKGLLPQKGSLSEHTASAILANHVLADRLCGLAAPSMISDFENISDYGKYFWSRDLTEEETKAVAELEAGLIKDGLSETRRFQTLCTLFCNSDLFIFHY